MLRGQDQIWPALPIVGLARDNSPQLRVFILEWISEIISQGWPDDKILESKPQRNVTSIKVSIIGFVFDQNIAVD
ncbi:hypothetical protein D3C87_2024100 [compost metagenome]